MFCAGCGKELPEGVRFCENCGAPVSPAAVPKAADPAVGEGRPISPNIVPGQDGKYRWVYEMHLLKNPTIFLLVWKIFFFIILGIFVLTAVVDLAEWGFSGEQLLNDLKFFVYFVLGMTVLVGVSVLIYAAIMGGKYVAVFEMDEEGVNHRQLPKQAEKAQAIAALTVLAGLAAGRPSTVGAGLTASRTEMYTAFASVRRVRASRRTGVIRVNQLLNHNMVCAAPEDFDFVLDYILQRVPEKARPKK